MIYNFIHIPKTAGTYFEKSVCCVNQNVKNLGHTFYDNQYIIDYRDFGNKKRKMVIRGYGDRVGENIAIIRNPFDLMCSYYHYRTKYHSGWANCNNIHEFKSFEEFIYSYCDPNFEWHLPILKKNIFQWIYKGDDINVDHLFRFENLNEELEYFCEKNNLKYIKNEKINVSDKKNYKFYYTTDMVDLLNIKFKKTLIEFNYNF